jgi:hypothetical protein
MADSVPILDGAVARLTELNFPITESSNPKNFNKDASGRWFKPVMGTHSFIRYIVTVTVTSLVTTVTNEHLQ